MNSIKNLKISLKIALGSGILLLLMSIMAATAFVGLGDAEYYFGEYRHQARMTNEVGRIQANMLMTRMGVKDFILKGDEKSIDQVHERGNTTYKLADNTLSLADDADSQEKLKYVEKNISNYQNAFTEAVNFQSIRNDHVDALAKIGKQAEQSLTKIMQSAFKDKDAESAYQAGLSLRNLLLMRLYVQKFLIDNTESANERALYERAEFKKQVSTMYANLQNPVRRKLAQETLEMVDSYAENYTGVYGAITGRNKVIQQKLDVIGPDVANKIEDFKLASKAIQDKIGPETVERIHNSEVVMTTIVIIAFIFGILTAMLTSKAIANPVVGMTDAMKRLAEKDMTTEVPARDRKDEIGTMAQAVQVFKDNMIKADELAAQQEQERAAREIRTQRIEELTKSFDDTVSAVLETVAAATNEMRTTAESMSATAEETNRQASAVAVASEQATNNVQTVATSAEELSSSIAEISRQVAHSSSISKTAEEKADQTNLIVQGLAEAAQRIGDVVNLINDIADQTNLLALNATIEAARAGDAGKGFAVVAGEVKSLASETSKATEEISQHISSVQSETEGAVTAIGDIGATIAEINEVATAIATAVEQQNAATQEIARNVQQASAGTNEVSSNITNVSQAATETGTASAQVLGAANQLSEQTESLKKEIETFLYEVKAA